MASSSGKRPRLSFDLGRYADFFAQMVDALPTTQVTHADGTTGKPLAALTERLLSDPTIALLDSAAAAADIVSFYQDRILNEGYLPTAVERRSLALLGRMLGFAPPGFVGATTEVAVFVQSGATAPVAVPAGAALQAAASGGKSGPIFELSQGLSAVLALNKLTPLQTRAPTLAPDATSTLIQGTGLGLSAGDPLLLAQTDAGGARQWLRLAVTRTRENHTLSYTEVFWGRQLQYQWEESGTGGLAPNGPTAGLDLYALKLSCKLFGYNAPAWSAQSYATQLANTPPGHYPGEYTEWPNFGIDLDNLDLQGVYSKVLPDSDSTPPDSVLLLEDPQTKRLGTISAVAPVMVSAFGMSGQVTEVTLTKVDKRSSGRVLQPARYGHTVTELPTGAVMIAGGDGATGVVESVELFDPSSQLLTVGQPLPAPRAFHTATVAGDVLVLIGGVDGDSLASTVFHLTLDGTSLSFDVADAKLATPRVRHWATALPDGRIMISGGCGDPDGKPKPADMDFETWFDSLTPLDSVTIYDPTSGLFTEEARLQHPRAAHTASLCPVYHGAWDQTDGGLGPEIGQCVVFVGGYDGVGAARKAWADAEVTMPWTGDDWGKQTQGQLVPQLFPIAMFVDGAWLQASGRYDHRATGVASQGVVLTGGADTYGVALGDTWLMCCLGYVAPVQSVGGVNPDPFILGVPSFSLAPQALNVPRFNHVAGYLPVEERVVLAGGQGPNGEVLGSVEFYALTPGAELPVAGASALSGPTLSAPLNQPQTLSQGAVLPTGQLFVSGGLSQVTPPIFIDTVETYDPASYTFLAKPGPIFPDDGSTYAPLGSVALLDGTVLILGAYEVGAQSNPLAWTYDPSTNLSSQTSAPNVTRFAGTLTLLQNGTVLVVGGAAVSADGAAWNTAEIYDPRSRAFHKVYSTMSAGRSSHTATALPDGTVLLTGGFEAPNTADLFNPVTQAFTPITTTLPGPVYGHAATSLQSGDVLISGGVPGPGAKVISSAAAVYSFADQAFARIDDMLVPRAYHTGTLLDDGRVMLTGGIDKGGGLLDSTEFYSPQSVGFSAGPAMAMGRAGHGAVLMSDTTDPSAAGSLLLLGGDAAGEVSDCTAELLAPDTGSGAPALLPLPVALPPWPVMLNTPYNLTVQPAYLAQYGVFSFGGPYGATAEAPGGTAPAALFVLPPPPPTIDARRQSLVFTQSQVLNFAPPIDTSPIAGVTLVLAGLIEDLKPGSPLLVTGQPPLALTVGEVGNVGGTAPVAANTPLMVTQTVPAPTGVTDSWWSVQTASGMMLTVATAPDGVPVTPAPATTSTAATGGFQFLSGNGKDIGNIPAALAGKFVRPVQGEMASVNRVTLDSASGTTTVQLDAPLRYYYDRTTMTLYGNVVEATQGSTIAGEVLGSGDGTVAFQAFTLKQAPLTFLADRGGGVQPALTVSVSGVPWTRVMTLSQSGPTDRHYQLTLDTQGRSRITFGDGVHGQRPGTGGDNITATYRIGAGPEGNVPAGALTRPPAQVGGVSGVLNPLPATGGVGAPGRGAARRQIPMSVQDLGRIVTEADFLSFVLNYPIVALATLSLEQPPTPSPPAPTPSPSPPTVLLTIAGPLGAVPDPTSDGFVSLQEAIEQAMPRPIPHQLFAYQPKLFKLVAQLTIDGPEAAVEAQAKQAIEAAYSPAVMRFGLTVRAADIALLLKKIPHVIDATVTALWAPAEESQTFNALLTPAIATTQGVAHGAQILSLSPDSDAVAFTLAPPTSGAAT